MPLAPDQAMTWAIDQLRDGRQDRYNVYYNYIDGIQPLSFATEKFKSAFGRSFEEFAYNRCANVVDAIADRLQVTGFGSDTDALGKAAKEIWDANQMSVREGQVEVEALTTGDAYVIVEAHPITGDVLIWPQDATQCRVRYSEDVPGRIEAGVKQWVDGDGYGRLNLYLPGYIYKYRTQGKIKTTAAIDITDTRKAIAIANKFEEYKPESDSSWPVATGIPDTCAIFHFANNGRINGYGVSELAAVIPLQDAINKSLMDLLVGMEFGAYAQRYLIGADMDDDDQVAALKAWVAGITNILSVPFAGDGAMPTAGQFESIDVEQYTKPVDLFDTLIARTTKIPVHTLTGQNFPESGRARRIVEAPFVAKLEDRQRSWGATWAEVERYSLRLRRLNIEPGALRTNWRSAAPLGQEDQLDMAQQMKAIGFAFPSILREMGYDPDQIAKIIEERDDEQDQKAQQFAMGGIDYLPQRRTQKDQDATNPGQQERQREAAKKMKAG